MLEASSITAVLGPTNTGKTHRAVECMLSHETGMIGLPLRLLAREVYDRLTTRVGESRVALVTGEEKRVPRRPDYWVCTVEAMPLDLEVDFLAVDEIQLAAHPQRGHVFTDRLLHARGRRETWFLGSESMKPIVSELVPTARLAAHPRLSRLTFAGAEKLTRLPSRAAVVAFSTPHVYELAERLKRAYGGVAVVLGALSPRTRNAQVAMFQSGEVDVLVATDAIGMGLNLGVDHVAFAALRKFDGREARDLETPEIAQIAGRAGRYRSDGTFGTLAPLQLPPGAAADIESHRFPAVRRLVWRSADLDFVSVEALLASLRRSPRNRALKLVEKPDDAAALEALASMPSVRERARGEELVRVLWEVCTVPDFRKLLLEAHVGLLSELFTQLSGPARALDEDWLARRVRELDEPAGDIDALLGKIAAVRTWTYVANRAGWVPNAAEWQARTREVEDRLSDALHERLVQRFVERGAVNARRESRARARAIATSANGGRDPAPAVQPSGAPLSSHPFARLAALRASLSPATAGRGGASADGASPWQWVENLVDAPHERFAVESSGRVTFDGRAVGQLVRGSRLLLPDVKLVGGADLRAGAHSRVSRRLVAFARDVVSELLAPLRAPAARALAPAARQVVYQLEQRLGTVLTRDVAGPLALLTAEDRAALRACDIELGARVVYVPALLRPAAVELRAALYNAHAGVGHAASVPRRGAVSIVSDPEGDPEAYVAIGYPVFSTRALRADVVERVAGAMEAPEGERPDIARLATWMGCPAAEVSWVVDAIVSGA